MPAYINFTVNPSDAIIKKLYSESDIFLFTSTEEGFALPPAEAMACKCAVVTTKVGAVSEYSRHMESAIHVEPKNEEDLYNGVKYLLDNIGEWRKISMNGYYSVKSKLDCWDDSTNKLENLFLSSRLN